MKRLSQLKAVPLLLRVEGTVYSLASAEDAELALVSVEPYKTGTVLGQRVMRVRDEALICVNLRYRQHLLVYANLAALTEVTPRAAQVAGVSLLAGRPLVVYGEKDAQIDIEAAFGERQVKPSAAALRYCSEAAGTGKVKPNPMISRWESSKVTGEYHTLLSPGEAIAAAPKSRAYAVACMLTILQEYTDTTALASGLLAFAACADEWAVATVLRSEMLRSAHDAEGFIGPAKRAAADLKTHQHFTKLPLEQLFELQVLANRGTGGVDWVKEAGNRLRPDLVDVSPELVYELATAIFKSAAAEGYRYASEQWSSFWERRWAFVPNGSVHSQYAEDEDYIEKDRLRRTKNFTLLKMADKGLKHWTSREPCIMAWASTKYEWAKERAIYGTDLTSYLLTDFVMPQVEEALSHRFPVGRKANEEYVANRLKLAGDAGVSLCYDYEDFNSQHSISSMAQVINAYVDVFWGSMSDEQRTASRWVQQSVYKQVVHSPTQTYQTKGTLLSGWRLTTCVNTVLNYVYLHAAGATRHMLDSVHNGDDVLCYVPSVKDAVEVMRLGKARGIRAQPAKCAIAGLEEFLRVDRKSVRPNSSQYLARGLATLVHARAESSEPQDMRQALQATNTRVDEVAQRGADAGFVDSVRELVSGRIASVFDAPQGDVAILNTTHVVHGGLCTDPDVEPEYSFQTPFTLPTIGLEEFTKLPGVNEFARYLTRLFDLSDADRRSVTEGVAAVTRSYVAPSRVAMVKSLVGDTKLAQVEQYLHRVCQHDYQVAAFTGKARLTGLPIGKIPMTRVSGMARERIACSANPLRTMAIIF